MEKMQFDKYLGGTYYLPRTVTLIDFLTARAPELAALNRAIGRLCSYFFLKHYVIFVE